MTQSRRLTPTDRRKQILNAAVELAQRDGYLSISQNRVAQEASVSPGLVYHYFPGTLKQAVMKEAIAEGHLSILAEGLAARDPVALRAPTSLRAAAIATL